MKPYTIVACIFLLAALFPGIPSDAQKLLILEKAGTVQNYKYNTGDMIRIRLKKDGSVTSCEINKITDTGFIINWLQVVGLNDISMVYRQRWFCSYFSPVALTAGIGYTFLEVLNNTINSKTPLVHESVFRASAVMIGAGALLRLFSEKHYAMGNNWRMRILDFSSLNTFDNKIKTNGTDKIH